MARDELDLEMEKLTGLIEERFREQPEVYVIKCEEYYKIGVSYDAWKRMKIIEKHNPHSVELFLHTEMKSRKAAYNVETKLHHLFKDKREKGEWFKLDKKDLKKVGEIFNKYANN